MPELLIRAVPSIPPAPPELERAPLVENQRSLGWISDHIAGVVEGKTPAWWWYALHCSRSEASDCHSRGWNTI